MQLVHYISLRLSMLLSEKCDLGQSRTMHIQRCEAQKGIPECSVPCELSIPSQPSDYAMRLLMIATLKPLPALGLHWHRGQPNNSVLSLDLYKTASTGLVEVSASPQTLSHTLERIQPLHLRPPTRQPPVTCFRLHTWPFATLARSVSRQRRSRASSHAS